jgi:hypothetical protein
MNHSLSKPAVERSGKPRVSIKIKRKALWGVVRLAGANPSARRPRQRLRLQMRSSSLLNSTERKALWAKKRRAGFATVSARHNE